MRSIDFLPKPHWADQLRDILGLAPSERELKRRREIAKDYGWPPVKYLLPAPPPPPAPPRRTDTQVSLTIEEREK